MVKQVAPEYTRPAAYKKDEMLNSIKYLIHVLTNSDQITPEQ